MTSESRLLLDYFPRLTTHQQAQLEQLGPLYREWNRQINVISRRDIAQLYEHHLLHSLAIAKFIRFQPGADILDLGTGGGLPGIPLAILFPTTRFTLIDGRRKKIKVVEAVSRTIGADNIKARHIRAEDLKQHFDFVVSRAVAGLDKLHAWSTRLIKNKQLHAVPNGLITLKGGAIQSEIKTLPKGSYVEVYPLSDYFREPYFEEKYLIYVQV